MDDIKSIIAENISNLRQTNGMTQLELAEKLNYSDKAVSKWERGESIPEIGTLTAIADLFDVPLDYMVKKTYDKSSVKNDNSSSRNIKISNHAIITGMSILLVFFIALCIYILIDIIVPGSTVHWISLLYAVPISMIVWLVFNSIWFNQRRNFLIISLLVWSLLASLHLSFWAFAINIWQIYILGIPAQIVIIMWSKLRYKHK